MLGARASFRCGSVLQNSAWRAYPVQVTDATTTAEARRRWRAAALPKLRGVVLDLGAGSGIAADHLQADVTWLPLEPRRTIDRSLRDRLAHRERSRLLVASAESIPVEAASVDAVIASTVLCSVRRPAQVLAEVRRVLRPGGEMVFFEHVAADAGTWTSALQTLFAPVSRLIDHGCDPHRDTAATIRAAGFASVELHQTTMPGVLGTVEPLIHGAAVN